jgi:hypothetical protein
MALAFISQIQNRTDQDIRFQWDEGGVAWSPAVAGFKDGLALLRGRADLAGPQPNFNVSNQSFSTASQLSIPWTASGNLQIFGPSDHVRVMISPKSASNIDYLRVLDSADQELVTVDLGPQGGGFWSAVWTFHLVFDSNHDTRWVTWDVNGAGLVFAAAAGVAFEIAKTGIGAALF